MTTVTRKVDFAKSGRRKRLVRKVKSEQAPPSKSASRIPRVSKLMALTIRFDGLINDGTVRDMSELARLAHVTQPRMTQIMNLLHLAPDIQEEILLLPKVIRGRDWVTERDIRVIAAEPRWERQQLMWTCCGHRCK